jgi:hypothetical protein
MTPSGWRASSVKLACWPHSITHTSRQSTVSRRPTARALVLELVEGPMLAERLRLGAIPVRDALVMARQIADTIVRCWRTHA